MNEISPWNAATAKIESLVYSLMEKRLGEIRRPKFLPAKRKSLQRGEFIFVNNNESLGIAVVLRTATSGSLLVRQIRFLDGELKSSQDILAPDKLVLPLGLKL